MHPYEDGREPILLEIATGKCLPVEGKGVCTAMTGQEQKMHQAQHPAAAQVGGRVGPLEPDVLPAGIHPTSWRCLACNSK